ncbi:aminotransferase [Endogone sp. FLAS-F59071]|nr:aminotransferase [Endogone sp. FLAS-F59071]|eukprot:RUS22678.1 aminotransferase [Endogone sp. FLAS-F59071]
MLSLLRTSTRRLPSAISSLLSTRTLAMAANNLKSGELSECAVLCIADLQKHFNSITTIIVTIERITHADNPTTEVIYDIKEDRTAPNDFFLIYPRGSYTGARTVHRHSIMDLSSHIDRIATSLQLMTFTPDAAASESEDVSRALAPFRDRDTLARLLVPMLKTGLRKYYEVEEKPSGEDMETKVSVVVAYSFEESRARFAAHFAPLPAPYSGRIRVEMEGEPRKLAGAKDSQWVRDRKNLELTKSPCVNEVLLSNPETGDIYEGLSSNFFAIYRGEAGTGQPATVRTAPLEYVLQGTIMKAVVAVCEREGIPIEWAFPTIGDAKKGKWEGAFVSSTSRLVLPIESIHFRDEKPSITFPNPSPVVDHIREEVRKEIVKRAYRIL